MLHVVLCYVSHRLLMRHPNQRRWDENLTGQRRLKLMILCWKRTCLLLQKVMINPLSPFKHCSFVIIANLTSQLRWLLCREKVDGLRICSVKCRFLDCSLVVFTWLQNGEPPRTTYEIVPQGNLFEFLHKFAKLTSKPSSWHALAIVESSKQTNIIWPRRVIQLSSNWPPLLACLFQRWFIKPRPNSASQYRHSSHWAWTGEAPLDDRTIVCCERRGIPRLEGDTGRHQGSALVL